MQCQVHGRRRGGDRKCACQQVFNRYSNRLSCDGVIWEFGYVDAKDRPIISLGMKGPLYVELIAKGPVRDAHSSLAVLIENPAWRLIYALNTMRDRDRQDTNQGLVQGSEAIYGARAYQSLQVSPLTWKSSRKVWRLASL